MIQRTTMANFFAFALLAGAVSSALHGAQNSSRSPFPYKATVAAEEAAIYSGPSTVHYVSASLKLGNPVEVYRHDPGGLCAIRPPKSSFSLIPATVVEERGNGVGIITEEGAQAWVGTELGPVEKPLWQVKLKAGEKVKLLGIATWPDPDGFTTSWYQIEPPAGEFRWVKMEDLRIPSQVEKWQLAAKEIKSIPKAVRDDSTLESELSDRVINLPKSQSKITHAEYVPENESFDSVEQASFTSQDRIQANRGFDRGNVPQPTNSGWRKARFPIERSGPKTDNFTSETHSSNNFASDVNQNSVPRESNNAPTAADYDRYNSPPERYASADLDSRYDFSSSGQPWSTRGLGTTTSTSGMPLTNRMTELELKLNQEMIKEPNQWRLIDLQTAAEQVVTISSDRSEQEQAQRFLAKLENCRYLRDQYIRGGAAGMNANDQSNPDGRTVQIGEGASNNGGGTDFSLNTMYDAHGWLKELVREGGRVEPTYVLQDASGKVTHHVLPGPGMNLSSYVSKRIGIMGQRGYHTRLKLDHVTAQKIIELK